MYHLGQAVTHSRRPIQPMRDRPTNPRSRPVVLPTVQGITDTALTPRRHACRNTPELQRQSAADNQIHHYHQARRVVRTILGRRRKRIIKFTPKYRWMPVSAGPARVPFIDNPGEAIRSCKECKRSEVCATEGLAVLWGLSGPGVWCQPESRCISLTVASTNR